MIADNSFKLEKKHSKNLKGRIEGYEFEVGILKDGQHKNALDKSEGFSSLAGGRVRRKSRMKSSRTISEVSVSIRDNTRINIYTAPFASKTNNEILKFSKQYINALVSNGIMKQKKRIENLIQAIVRNPITRGDYGRNAKSTAKEKGFNRFLIDTGQLFKAITARIIRKVK